MSDQSDDVIELIEKVKTAKYAKKMAEALHRVTYEQLSEYKAQHGDSNDDVFEALVYTQVGALKNILIQLSKTFAMTRGKSISPESIDELEDVVMNFFDEDLWEPQLPNIPASQLN